MPELNIYDIQIIMSGVFFSLGLLSFLAGLLVLVVGSWRSDLRTLTTQTAKLAQKGITEDISGLVGNASALLDAINSLVLTTRGIGVFLTMLGVILMGIPFIWMLISPLLA
jgi:hypothetical protein